MTTVYKIYFTHPETQSAQAVNCEKLTDALSLAESFRKKGMTFVTMVSENTDLVGKPGADAVANGKLPNGNDYDWNMTGRIGKLKQSQKDMLITKDSDDH